MKTGIGLKLEKKSFAVFHPAALLILLLCAGCYTSVTVQRVGKGYGDHEGLRVNLPARFLVGRLDTNFAGSGDVFTTNDITKPTELASSLKTWNLPELRGILDSCAGYPSLSNHLLALETKQKVDKDNTLGPIVSDAIKKFLKLPKEDLLSSTNGLDPSGLPLAVLRSSTSKDPEVAAAARILLLNAFPQTLVTASDNPMLEGNFQVNDWANFCQQIAFPKNGVSALFAAQIGVADAATLAKYVSAAQGAAALTTDVVVVLNQVLTNKTLTLDALSKGEPQSPETMNLSTLNKTAQIASNYPRLNHWVLYDLFRANLAKPTSTRIIYDVEMLPDPSEEYAISACQIMAKQSVSITRSPEMYLQTLTITQDSTTVAAAMAAGAGQFFQRSGNSSTASQVATGTNGLQTTQVTTTTTASFGGSGGGGGGGSTAGAGAGAAASASGTAAGSSSAGSGGNGAGGGSGQGSSQTSTTTTTTTSAGPTLSGPVVVVYRLVEPSFGDPKKDPKQNDLKLEQTDFVIYKLFDRTTEAQHPANLRILLQQNPN